MHLLRQIFLLNPVITRVIDPSIGIYICYSFPEKLNHAEVLDHNETIRGVLVGMELNKNVSLKENKKKHRLKDK